jgi:hypothetical protein
MPVKARSFAPLSAATALVANGTATAAVSEEAVPVFPDP